MIRRTTSLPLMLYGVYLYYASSSMRLASRALEPMMDRTHVSIWRWVQRLARYPDRFSTDRRSIRCIFVDETLIRIGGGSIGSGLRMNLL